MSYLSRRSALACSFLLILTACGGGGGGSSSLSGGGGSPTTQLTPIQAPSGQQTVQATSPNQQGQTARVAANTLPNFGSVTQSSNRGANGISTDAATATFDGQDVRVTIERLNGSTFVLDTSDDVFLKTPFASDIPELPLAQAAYVGELTSTSFYLAYVGVSWADASSFLAGGYWMRGDGIDTSSPSFEMGAFVDGPEISQPTTLPSSGTASYRGTAQGFYHHTYGTSTAANIPVGTQEIGEVVGVITLDVNFGISQISGCVGCAEQSRVTAVAVDPQGRYYEYTNVPITYRVIYGPTSIDSNGRFRDSNVRLVNSAHAIQTSSGSWGGQFSNIPDADGIPRLVTGTGGGEYTHADGAHGVWIGAFFGTR